MTSSNRSGFWWGSKKYETGLQRDESQERLGQDSQPDEVERRHLHGQLVLFKKLCSGEKEVQAETANRKAKY